MITIVIPGPPIPQTRHKSSRRHGYLREYDPLSIIKHGVRETIIKPQLHEKNIQFDAYSIKMEFRMPLSKSDSKKRTAAKLDGSISPTSRPDLDNFCKFICDVGNELLWPDDSKIVEIYAIKRYHKEPSTIITIAQYGKLNEDKN